MSGCPTQLGDLSLRRLLNFAYATKVDGMDEESRRTFNAYAQMSYQQLVDWLKEEEEETMDLLKDLGEVG